MQITITLNSLEELDELTTRILVGGTNDDVRANVPKTDKNATKSAEDTAPAPAKKATKKAEEPVKEPEKEEAPAADPEPEKKAEEPKKSKHTESELKSLITHKLTDGKKKEVKDLFLKWGAEKLSDVLAKNPDKIDEIYADAEEV